MELRTPPWADASRSLRRADESTLRSQAAAEMRRRRRTGARAASLHGTSRRLAAGSAHSAAGCYAERAFGTRKRVRPSLRRVWGMGGAHLVAR
eukprot:1999950-Prymnesium_polylepis.1